MTLASALDQTAARTRFSGVVGVLGGEPELLRGYGLAHRSTGTQVTTDTRFGTASGSKTMTALVVLALVVEGRLGLDTPARDLLGEDLPLVDDAVTVRHLLTHTSGIGDYLDEEELEEGDYVLRRPVHEYLTTSDFLPDLQGHPQVFGPGERFTYCNGGYVVLALLAERAASLGYHDLVRTRVLEPAGMTDSGFFRGDALPARTATGYLGVDDDAISNVFHLPILATGDGGLHTTAADVHRFFVALHDGRLLPDAARDQMLTVQTPVPDYPGGYGFGMWLRENADGVVQPTMQGEDAGVSFVARHDPVTGLTRVILSNTADGAWPMWDTLLD